MMALYLPDSKALYIHIPKCGGHWVEEVLKRCGIPYRHATPKPGKSHRHGRAEDYVDDVKFTFTTLRPEDEWMLSYWRFHMMAGHNRKQWGYDGDEPHRVLGPPLSAWQVWSRRVTDVRTYMASMVKGVNALIDPGHWVDKLASILSNLGYNVTPEQVAAVPRQNQTMLKIELGGGTRARGDGFANIDVVPEADFNWNLDEAPYPFPDDSVDELYSSHCLEHLECPHRTFREIARICRIGAAVEIRVPHPTSHMAMCAGHKHVVGPLMIDNIDKHFPELHWTGRKRLKLQNLTYGPTTWLPQAKRELPFLAGLDDQTIMRWIPNTCHESIFQFKVIPNDSTV